LAHQALQRNDVLVSVFVGVFFDRQVQYYRRGVLYSAGNGSTPEYWAIFQMQYMMSLLPLLLFGGENGQTNRFYCR
jgi:hypothetical protein